MASNKTVENKQLTIRLSPEVIDQLDVLTTKLQNTAPGGMSLTRTDALRTAIISGLEALKVPRASKRR